MIEKNIASGRVSKKALYFKYFVISLFTVFITVLISYGLFEHVFIEKRARLLVDAFVFCGASYLLILCTLLLLIQEWRWKTLSSCHGYFMTIVGLFLLSYFLLAFAPFADIRFMNSPLIQDDYALHFINAYEMSLFFKKAFRIWGFNPFYFAGYPSGLWLAVSNRWAFLFQVVFGSFLNTVFTFNLSILLSYLILPLFSFFAARNFRIGNVGSLFFLIFSGFLANGFYFINNFRTYGCYGFVLASFVSFYIFSLFYRYMQEKKNATLIALSFWGGLGFFIHPLSFVICLVLCFPLTIFYWGKSKAGDLLKLLLCMVVIIILNLPWIIPFAKFHYLSAINQFGAVYFQTTRKLLPFVLRNETILRYMFLLFVVFILRFHRERLAMSVLFSFILFFLISFYGSELGLHILQPARFMIPEAVLCVFSFSLLVQRELEHKNFFMATLVVLFLIFLRFEYKPLPFGYDEYPQAGKIINIIKSSTSTKARIHVQDAEKHYYFYSHFTASIPYLTGRPVLAGPYTYAFSMFDFTQFFDYKIFERKLKDFPFDELKKYLELYNIKYFLIFSKEAREYFDDNPMFRKMFETDYSDPRFQIKTMFSFYEYLGSEESYCYGGHADVTADFDKIAVNNAPTNGCILKFHYFHTLKVKPESVTIKPIKMLNDPIPFIQVENRGCTSFEIYNE